MSVCAHGFFHVTFPFVFNRKQLIFSTHTHRDTHGHTQTLADCSFFKIYICATFRLRQGLLSHKSGDLAGF